MDSRRKSLINALFYPANLMNNFFIDKLNVVQNHDGLSVDDLPNLGDVKHYRVDLQTGDTKDISKFVGLEGSYSSYLSIRVSGSQVEVYGNPSRWGRLENLFGFKTLDECFQVYNSILFSLGLPVFTKSTKYVYFTGKDGKSVNKTADGAIIRHIDFTCNHAVGKGNERAFLKGLSTQSIERSISPFLYPDENTVEWYGKNAQKSGSRYRYVKCYNKTSDLLRHQNRANSCSYEDQQYYEKVINYCYQNGVIREEHSFKSKYLKNNDFFAWGLFDEFQFNDDLQCLNKIRRNLSVSNMNFETIQQQLIDQNICSTSHSANSTATYYYLWLHGHYFDTSKSQFRVHKSRLLKLGIDISVKLDISRAPIRLKECQEIECSPLSVPDFYRSASVEYRPHLRLVA